MNRIIEKIKSNMFPFVAATTIIVGCCTAWYLNHPSSPYHDRYKFVVRYEAIGTLSPGNRVGVRGITCGQIVKVQLTEDAVYVTAEVLARTKIPRNSEFRLITSGLMGEREMSVLTGDSPDLIADGDTVNGLFDNGTSGISKDLFAAMSSLIEIKDKLVALKDSVTTGSSGQRIERIVNKSGKIVKLTKNVAGGWKESVEEIMEKCDQALQKAKAIADAVPKESGATLEKAQAIVEKLDALSAKLDNLKAEMDSLSSKLEQDDNTAGLIVSKKGALIGEIEAILKDIDSLTTHIKKGGLQINVDIF